MGEVGSFGIRNDKKRKDKLVKLDRIFGFNMKVKYASIGGSCFHLILFIKLALCFKIQSYSIKD
jgi:hypothetical protein